MESNDQSNGQNEDGILPGIDGKIIQWNLDFIDNVGFNKCPLKPIVNKWSRFYGPFADDQKLNNIEISLYNHSVLHFPNDFIYWNFSDRPKMTSATSADADADYLNHGKI